MSSSAASFGPVQFNLDWMADFALTNPEIFWGALGMGYLFWISRKNGLLGLLIDYLKTRMELKAKVELGRQALFRKFGPMLGANAATQALPHPPPPPPTLPPPGVLQPVVQTNETSAEARRT